MKWAISRRAQQLTSSAIREILKVTERPEVISFAGGLPSPASFPVAAMEEAVARVFADNPQGALQCAASEGYRAASRAAADELDWSHEAARLIAEDERLTPVLIPLGDGLLAAARD